MNRIRFLSAIAGLTVAAASVLAADSGIMSVQVKSGELRDTPSFLGNVVDTLEYGDRVTVTERRGSWMRASAVKGAANGWIHSSALTTQKIRLEAGESGQTGASSGELALAGKGFNSDVEAQFKAQNRNLDFAQVDRIEAMKIPFSRLATFLKQGGLGAAKGGSK